MDLLDESKENIQPLRRGRNISTLNTALQAQTDAEVHQQLMKEREEFEILVRSYVGDDPLKPWYDYVLWVEQNFPKHGREGNLKVLLENCLLHFKDNEQYSQDVRFIDLWTRYMSFADDPLEMYKQLHARGIGAQCAIFYHCWAEEFEKANDMKRADQIYIEGLRRNAQPVDELESAHTNFQVRVARSILGQNPVINQEPEFVERTALSTLRAHGRRKNMVDSARVGNSIKHTTPGVLRPHTNVPLSGRRNGNVQASKLAVYNDENAPASDAVAHPVVKTTVSLSQQMTNNKENTLKPGRWNEGKFKKKSSASGIGMTGVPTTPRNPTFHVHVDENSDVPKTPKTDIVVSNVLKMRRHVYDDEKSIPVAMFEPPDPKKVAMYPKSKVYSGGTEFSLEELRAIIYLKREEERQNVSYEKEDGIELKSEIQDVEMQVSYDKEVVCAKDGQKYVSEEHYSQQLNVHKQEAIISERTEIKQQLSQKNNNFEIYVESEEEMDAKLELKPQQFEERKEKKSAAPSAQIPLFKDIPVSGFLKLPRSTMEHKERVVPPADEMCNSGPSFEQRECDQSLTVNTKAVLNEVRGMWVSSPQAEPNPARVSFDPRPSIPARTTPISAAPTSFTPFKIFSDTSMRQAEQPNSVDVASFETLEGRHLEEKKREIKVAAHPKETSESSVPQKNVIRGSLFNTYLINKQNSQTAEKHAFQRSSESALQDEKEIFQSFKQPIPVPQTSSDFAPLGNLKTPRDNLSDCKVPSVISTDDELPKPSMGIPFVPSPGMSPAQLEALKGTEDKENMLRGKFEEMPQSCRSKKSILQPSKDIYFVPLEQQMEENDTTRENVFSDDTCCTEAFAIPLVASTPMLHPHLKPRIQENPNEKEEDNTIALMNLLQRNANIYDNAPPAYEAAPKIPKFSEETYDVPELLHSSARVSEPNIQLSTIFELSEQKKSSSVGTADESCIPSTFHQLFETELREEIEMFRNMEQNRRSSDLSTPQNFFSGNFRNHCLESSGFPSHLHHSHCVQLHMPFDMIIRQGSVFVVGKNQFRVSEVVSEENGILYFSAAELFSKKFVDIELKDNSYLWEQYIREELRLRLQDQSMIKHFHANEKTYLYANKFLRVFDRYSPRNLKDIVENGISNLEVYYVTSEIMNILFHLHKCKIVHGSLSLESFTCVSDRQFLFLNNFINAVDMALLPANTVFDATELPMYYKLHACRLSPFQVDYIALANILHQLIFRKPMKVHEVMGKWHISSALPRNFDKELWDSLFRELLNNSEVDLLQFRYVLEECMNSRKEGVH